MSRQSNGDITSECLAFFTVDIHSYLQFLTTSLLNYIGITPFLYIIHLEVCEYQNVDKLRFPSYF